MHIILFVSRDVEQATDVLSVWVDAGVDGVTILESAGMRQALDQGIRDDVGLVFSLSSLLRSQEVHHRTLFSAIRDDAVLQRVIDATTDYIGGDWSKPDVGVLLVVPLAQAYGLDKHFR